MIITDTHTHLYHAPDHLTIQRQVQNALNKGVSRFFLPNIDASTIAPLFDVVSLFPQYCFPMLGLHPCSVDDLYEHSLLNIQTAFEEQKSVCAVGEIGLDYFHSRQYVKQQREAFLRQLSWAADLNLPVCIHLRQAFEDFVALVQEFNKPLTMVVHCFSGTHQEAETLLEMGFMLGIGGILTYKNSNLAEVLKDVVPLDRIVLETDAPYLAPVPHRGKRNESAFVYDVALKLAETFELSLEEIAAITTANSKTLFRV